MSLYLRTVTGVQKHFASRLTEWGFAIILANWGWIIMSPNVNSLTLKAFEDLTELVTPHFWGSLAVGVGVARIISLVINGSFTDTTLFKYAPIGRLVCSYISVFFWFQMSVSLFKLPGGLNTGMAVYPVIMLMDAWNVYQTAGDTRALQVNRDGRR